MAEKVTIAEHGNFIYGTLDGVDFVTSGVNTESKRAYGSSVKLRFIMRVKKVKDSNGVPITTTASVSQILQIKCEDSQLPTLVNKYNELLDKDLFISYGGKEGDVFQVFDETSIIVK